MGLAIKVNGEWREHSLAAIAAHVSRRIGRPTSVPPILIWTDEELLAVDVLRFEPAPRPPEPRAFEQFRRGQIVEDGSRGVQQWELFAVPVEQARRQLDSRVLLREAQVRSQGVVRNGHRVSTDDGMRATLASIGTALAAGAAYRDTPFTALRLSDETPRRVVFDADAFAQLASAIAAQDRAAMMRADELEQQISRATTLDELRTIASEFDEGWP